MPPYWRAVVPSAWAKASNIAVCSSCLMPMPVSATLIAITDSARSSRSCPDPSRRSSLQAHGDLAALGELERVGEQVLQHLAEAMRSP